MNIQIYLCYTGKATLEFQVCKISSIEKNPELDLSVDKLCCQIFFMNLYLTCLNWDSNLTSSKHQPKPLLKNGLTKFWLLKYLGYQIFHGQKLHTSSHFPDRFCTPSKNLPDTIQTPSRCLQDTFTSSWHVPDTFQTSFRHIQFSYLIIWERL